MDKTGFLKELKRYLVVLNEGEQKDILDEYSQHIDMKMERGMSEAEAIRDFGDIEELASEILEAYHVNPQYGAGKHVKFVRKEEIPVADIAEKSRKFWSGIAGFFKKVWEKAETGLAGLWNLVKKPFRYAKEAWEKRKEHKKPRTVHLAGSLGQRAKKSTEEKYVWRDIRDGRRRLPEIDICLFWPGSVVCPLDVEFCHDIGGIGHRLYDAVCPVWAGDAGGFAHAGVSADGRYAWLPGRGTLPGGADCDRALPLPV